MSLIFALAIPASAADDALENGIAEDGAQSTESTLDVDESKGPDEAEKNAFELLFGYVEEHATEIFSALAFFGSVAIIIIYKRGLLPALTASVGKVSTVVGKFLDTAKESGECTNASLSALTDNLTTAKDTLEGVSGRLEALTEELSKAEDIRCEQERIRLVLLTEIDLLYDIFAASSLPQYRKDLIGERVAKMKNELGGASNEEAAS